MKALLAALVLLVSLVSPVRSDVGLEGLVAEAYFPRVQSAELHEIAHARAVEIAQPGGWCHCGIRDGTAEVLAYNGVGPERAVEQWQGSPSHDAILSDPQWGLIGCATHFDGVYHWSVCVLTWAPAPVPPPAPPAPAPVTTPAPRPEAPEPVMLPDTAMPRG